MDAPTLVAPHLDPVHVPGEAPGFGLDAMADAVRFFQTEGYVVMRQVVDARVLSNVLAAFDREVRPYDNYVYRQTTCNPEKHKFSEAGFMMNPILNIQDLRSSDFRDFRLACMNAFTSAGILEFAGSLHGESPKFVQSMYFEGNPATWAHQDTYYLDAQDLRSMVGSWIAVEDIDEGAGRFYVYPKSHLVDMFRNSGKFDVAFNHQRYKDLVLDVIRENDLRCVAPSLQAGDVLFWSSKTIHGSLETTHQGESRRSITAHFIPESHSFLQHQTRNRPLSLSVHNGVSIHSPKSQDEAARRALMALETKMPKQFQLAKKLATKLSIAVRSRRPVV